MLNNSYKGKFFVFDGPGGSGKSLQAQLLVQNLLSRGFEVLLTDEPTKSGPTAERIERALRGEDILDAGELQELFVLDRKEHLEREITPALEAGKMVVSDRYFLSTVAYGSLECRMEWLIKLNDPFLLPDATFVFLAPPEVLLQRIEERRREVHIFETSRSLRRVSEAYLELAKRFPRTYVLDGEQSIADLHGEILRKVKPVLE